MIKTTAFGVLETLSRFLHLTTRRLRAKQKDTPQSGRDPLQDLRVLDSRQGQEQEETTRLFCRFETLGKNEKMTSMTLQHSVFWQEWDQEPMYWLLLQPQLF